MAPTLLVTGSEGYIGSSLLPRLAGFDIVSVDRMATTEMTGRVIHVTADLARESARVRQSLPPELRLDALIHLAARADASLPWGALYEDNVVGTLRAYELAQDCGIRTVIFASSVHVVDGYARHPETWPVGIDALPWPTSSYGVSKIVGESFLQMLYD